jgi:hypothetical protein
LVSELRGDDLRAAAPGDSWPGRATPVLMIPPVVKAGELVRLKEPDYCYGLGDLVIRVTEVPAHLTDPEWVDIKGTEIAWNGATMQERQVTARVSALRDPRSRQVP